MKDPENKFEEPSNYASSFGMIGFSGNSPKFHRATSYIGVQGHRVRLGNVTHLELRASDFGVTEIDDNKSKIEN